MNRPLVVLIHGFLGSAHQWDVIGDELSNHFEVVRYELPGHGNRFAEVFEYSIEDLADEVYAKIENHLSESIHVIGHSMGGYIAAALTGRHPEVLSNTVLINSITGPDSSVRIKNRNRSLRMIDRYHKAFVSMAISNLFNASEHNSHSESIELMKNQAAQIPETAVRNAIIAMRDRKGCTNEWPDSIRLTYIFSKNDPIIDDEIISNEARFLNADLHELDSGHMGIITHPKQIIEILKPILQFH
ncbi:hypothetical protein BST97_10410 [Nonlabens spongiae]|uniref:AB hydrolase-1 domain-containing protein n=1 Tax=Nonlabens spongiae TaxID=331648 RepID=A0A1W6MLH0_9FLAO|nr:alpha/beta hydrolase [Nonlabens spongiae]ARN78366.1 hypothetical protein BST97_10410 [Nonlabens spongiae]